MQGARAININPHLYFTLVPTHWWQDIVGYIICISGSVIIPHKKKQVWWSCSKPQWVHVLSCCLGFRLPHWVWKVPTALGWEKVTEVMQYGARSAHGWSDTSTAWARLILLNFSHDSECCTFSFKNPKPPTPLKIYYRKYIPFVLAYNWIFLWYCIFLQIRKSPENTLKSFFCPCVYQQI